MRWRLPLLRINAGQAISPLHAVLRASGLHIEQRLSQITVVRQR